MGKKTLSAKEILCGIPRLRDYFSEMDRIDLRIVYYIHRLNKIYPHDIARALEKLFHAQEEFKSTLKGGEEGVNLVLR